MNNDSITHKIGSDKYWMPTSIKDQTFPLEVRINHQQFYMALIWADQTRDTPMQGRTIIEMLPDDSVMRQIAYKLIEKGVLVPSEQPRHYVMFDLARAHVEYYRERVARRPHKCGSRI